MMMNRRGVLGGLASMLAAPAIVHAGNLMPIRGVLLTPPPRVLLAEDIRRMVAEAIRDYPDPKYIWVPRETILAIREMLYDGQS